jgi:Tfp pilus assembly protein PilX
MTPATCPGGDRQQRGFALIAAVLVLMLTAILAITYLTVTTGERTQSANVHVARNSLYAADAGVRAIEQAFANGGKTKLDSLTNYQAGSDTLIKNPSVFFTSFINSGGGARTSTNPPFTASGTVSFYDSTLTPNAQAYDFLFTINSTGTRGSYGKRMVQSQGILRVSASRGSFADYLLFTAIHTMPDNSAIWFTSSSSFDGRMHTNGEFRFAYKPTFQDLASSVNSKAWFYNGGGTAKELAANNNGTIDVPYFYGGFNRGATSITLPADPYNQQNAALGNGLPTVGVTAPPSNAQIRAALGLSGTTAPPNDVYLASADGVNVTGGIYVQGDLTQCTMRVDGAGNQVYVLKQGTSTDSIRVNRSTTPAITTLYNSTNPSGKTYSGAPAGCLFTTGSVLDLRGPERVDGVPPPALAHDTQLLIAASNDIVVSRDVTCSDYATGNNVLGLYTTGGSVRIAYGTGVPNNMNLDAFIMAAGSSGAFEVDNHDSGSPRGTFHLRGGAVTKYYGAFFTFNNDGTLKTGYARDFHYDRRGLVPPYYPTTPRMNADVPTARTLSWKEL